MTGDLLQSDIDLARRLIAAGETDAQIIVALSYRRIGGEKALSLARALRDGIDVQPDPFRPAIGSSEPRFDRPPADSRPEPKRSQPQPKPTEGGSQFPWFRLALLSFVALSIAAVFLINRKAHTPVSAASRELMVKPAATLRRPVLQVEIDPGGVRVSGTVLSRENALKTLSDIAGPAARTNHVEDLTMYAFDHLGTVLYSGNKGGKDSLLLYFEPVGGTNGALHAFSGTLTVRGNPVAVTTEPKSLLAVPELALKETSTNVFSGQFAGLGLSFVYLTSSGQLSLVQIDLE